MSLDWMDRGACLDEDPELFSPLPSDNPAEAKAVCARCPVTSECLAYALADHLAGVWGGTTDDERKALGRRDSTPTGPACGEYRGVNRHRRRKEPICRACKDAANEFKRELRAARREEANR